MRIADGDSNLDEYQARRNQTIGDFDPWTPIDPDPGDPFDASTPSSPSTP